MAYYEILYKIHLSGDKNDFFWKIVLNAYLIFF